MAQTFTVVRDNIDSDQWRLVTDAKYVWASVFCDFFVNGAMPHLQDLIALNATQAVECVITTKAHYDQLMAEADRQQGGTG